MPFRRTPAKSRVADAWLRRTGDARPPGGESKFREFLKDEGSRKVRAPGRDDAVTINTLNRSDEPSDRKRVQEEYAKWSGGDDTANGRGVIDSPQKLKAVQDDLVEDAVGFGVPKATAREMVMGLVVGDDESAVMQVERNLQRAIDKAVADKQKADADAEEKSKGEEAKAEEKTKAKADAEKALTELQGKQERMISDAVKAGVPEEDARALAKELKEGDGKAALDEVRDALKPLVDRARRKAKRDRAMQVSKNSEQAVAEARAMLDRAKKSKDKNAIAKAQAELDRAEDADYLASLNAHDAELAEFDEQLADEEVAALEAAETVRSTKAVIDDGEERLSRARESGDVDLAASIEQSIRAARDALEKAEANRKRLDQSIAEKTLAKNKRLVELSKAEFEKSWARAERNRGMLLFDADGNATRYDPSKGDKAYEFFMALLGEQIRKRGLPEAGTNPVVSPFGEDDTDADDWSGGAEDDPRRPTGGDPDDHGPGEFWEVGPGTWSAKDSGGNIGTFETLDGAKAHAKKATSMRARVAYRYMTGYGR